MRSLLKKQRSYEDGQLQSYYSLPSLTLFLTHFEIGGAGREGGPSDKIFFEVKIPTIHFYAPVDHVWYLEICGVWTVFQGLQQLPNEGGERLYLDTRFFSQYLQHNQK